MKDASASTLASLIATTDRMLSLYDSTHWFVESIREAHLLLFPLPPSTSLAPILLCREEEEEEEEESGDVPSCTAIDASFLLTGGKF